MAEVGSFQQHKRQAMATSYARLATMSAGAYSWRYILKCVSYHGLKRNGRRSRKTLGNAEPFTK